MKKAFETDISSFVDLLPVRTTLSVASILFSQPRAEIDERDSHELVHGLKRAVVACTPKMSQLVTGNEFS